MKKRRKKKPKISEEQRDKANLALEDFLTDEPKKRQRGKRTRTTRSIYELALMSAKTRSKTGDWSDAKARAFVGLYALCHQLMYDVEVLELKADVEMKKATRLARKCLRDYFDNDTEEFAAFVLWVWQRQKRRENWAITQGKKVNRLTVWNQFSAAVVTDYRKEQTTRKKKRV